MKKRSEAPAGRFIPAPHLIATSSLANAACMHFLSSVNCLTRIQSQEMFNDLFFLIDWTLQYDVELELDLRAPNFEAQPS